MARHSVRSPYTGAGVKIRVFDKKPLLRGEPVRDWTDFANITSPSTRRRDEGRLLPAIHFGAADRFFLVSTRPCDLDVWSLDRPLAAPSLEGRSVRFEAIECRGEGPPDAEQPGGAPPLDNRGSAMSAPPVYRDGRLWVSHSVRMRIAGKDVSAVHWLELDVSGWPDAPLIVQEAVLAGEATHYFYPALMVDEAENMALVVARSSVTEFASIYYTGRLAWDPPDLLRTVQVLKAGTDVGGHLEGNRNRYADFFGTALDPSDGSIWMHGQYANGTSEVATWVGNVLFERGRE